MKPARYADLRAAGMYERDLLAAARGLARTLRLRTYHPHRSDRSEPGWPDLAVLGPGGFLLRELKTQKGRPTREQAAWLAGLQAAGIDAGLWRPTDWYDGRIEQELRELR